MPGAETALADELSGPRVRGPSGACLPTLVRPGRGPAYWALSAAYFGRPIRGLPLPLLKMPQERGSSAPLPTGLSPLGTLGRSPPTPSRGRPGGSTLSGGGPSASSPPIPGLASFPSEGGGARALSAPRGQPPSSLQPACEPTGPCWSSPRDSWPSPPMPPLFFWEASPPTSGLGSRRLRPALTIAWAAARGLGGWQQTPMTTPMGGGLRQLNTQGPRGGVRPGSPALLGPSLS